MPSKWNYGDAYLRHPIGDGQVAVFEDGSMVKTHNIFDPLPAFMLEADLVFVDPPWNLGNLNTFYTKADRDDKQDSFEVFYKRLFECIGEIAPVTCYVEVGKEYLNEFIKEMKLLYPAVTFYNSTYYHKKENLCYVVRGGAKRKKLPLDHMDEEDIIAWVCANEDYTRIGDLCMGRGLVGVYAHKNGKRFVGTELNHKRLSVLLERLSHTGAKYELREGLSMEALEEVLTISEAAALWRLDPSTVKKACQSARIKARKSGKTWLVTRAAMKKVFGTPKEK